MIIIARSNFTMAYNHLYERQALVSTKDPSIGKSLVSVEFSPLVSMSRMVWTRNLSLRVSVVAVSRMVWGLNICYSSVKFIYLFISLFGRSLGSNWKFDPKRPPKQTYFGNRSFALNFYQLTFYICIFLFVRPQV